MNRASLHCLCAAGVPKQTAKVGVRAPDGGVAWSTCVVLDVDTQHNRYLVQQQAAGVSRTASPMPGTPGVAALDTPGSRSRASGVAGLTRASVTAGGGTVGPPFWVPRVQLCFTSEDPSLYAARFAAAQSGLAAADAQLTFELCVDSMPVEDVPQLTTEQVNRVLGWALNSQKLQEKLMDTSSLINEANLEHTRTLSKVMLQALVATDQEAAAADAAAAGQGVAVAGQLLPITVPPVASKPLPGRVPMPAGYEFKEQLSEFAFKTLLTRPEVISALSKIQQELSKVRGVAGVVHACSTPD